MATHDHGHSEIPETFLLVRNLGRDILQLVSLASGTEVY